MKRVDLDIYREGYEQTGRPGKKNQSLADIWDKITNALEDHGLSSTVAQYAGLLITEWIRTTWGGLVLIERHSGEAKDVSRFDLLRDRTNVIIAEVAPELPSKTAAAAVAEIVRAVRVDYRGKYIPKIKKLDQLQRDFEIYRKGTTPAMLENLALEHGITLVRAYQINKAVQKRKDKREQPMLPFG